MLRTVLNILQKWKSTVDNDKVYKVLLTDLSTELECIIELELIIAKLNAYSFTLPPLKLINNCLINQKQRTEIDNAFSSWKGIFYGVAQVSITRPLSLNIFITDLFLVIDDIHLANYVDANTIYCIKDLLLDKLKDE